MESSDLTQRTRSFPVLLLLVMLLSLTVSACSDDEAADDLPLRTVRLATVQTGDVIERVELNGELEGTEEVRVFAETAERIRGLAVREGDTVKAGDVLVTLHGDIQSEALRQAEAALEAAMASRDGTTDTLRRTRALAGAGAVSESQLEAMEAQARGAEAQVRQARAAVAQAAAQQSKSLITSPIDGVVAQLQVRRGDMVSPSMPILTVVQSHALLARFRVPEREFLRVEPDMPVRLAPLGRPEHVIGGRVTMRSPMVDRMTRTGVVEAHIENPDGLVLPGSAVRGRIELSRRPGVVLVPAEAILFTSETRRTGHALAFVAEGDRAVQRTVRVGVRQADQLEILAGLTEGETLVVEGSHFLRDGNPISALPPRSEDRL